MNRHTVCIAPMMRHSDRNFRYLMRLFSKRMMLYSEMISCQALLHGPRQRLLHYNRREQPLALQIGGSEPRELARAAHYVRQAGYDEINLNVGCPSGRVQAAQFGACLMRQPERVAECVQALRRASGLPVTVKCRIGISGADSFSDLCRFVATISQAGCRTFIVHARKAVLKGLTPAQNRTVPPLRHEWVYRLKQTFPHLAIITNGGIDSMDKIASHLAQVDGVMIGRAAWRCPWFLHEVEAALFQGRGWPSREALLAGYLPYMEAEQARGVPIAHCLRHLPGLFRGQANARRWRALLAPGQGLRAIREALRGCSDAPSSGPRVPSDDAGRNAKSWQGTAARQRSVSGRATGRADSSAG